MKLGKSLIIKRYNLISTHQKLSFQATVPSQSMLHGKGIMCTH